MKKYFILNDTRYDNHHGCETVISNLMEGMVKRGWECVGSLPVSGTVKQLAALQRILAEVELVVVNGEGSLHHDQTAVGRIFECIEYCQKDGLPIVLLNALWQDNTTEKYLPQLRSLALIYARDRRSQHELERYGITCHYAPDLTFYSEYAENNPVDTAKLGFTDSVDHAKSAWLLSICKKMNGNFLPALFRSIRHFNPATSGIKRLKFWLYPRLLGVPGVRPRQLYINMAFGFDDTALYLEALRKQSLIVAGRYHVICFCLQNSIPFLALDSNSHKIIALLEEVGLPSAQIIIKPGIDLHDLQNQILQVQKLFPLWLEPIQAFNRHAREEISHMLDQVSEVAG